MRNGRARAAVMCALASATVAGGGRAARPDRARRAIAAPAPEHGVGSCAAAHPVQRALRRAGRRRPCDSGRSGGHAVAAIATEPLAAPAPARACQAFVRAHVAPPPPMEAIAGALEFGAAALELRIDRRAGHAITSAAARQAPTNHATRRRAPRLPLLRSSAQWRGRRRRNVYAGRLPRGSRRRTGAEECPLGRGRRAAAYSAGRKRFDQGERGGHCAGVSGALQTYS